MNHLEINKLEKNLSMKVRYIQGMLEGMDVSFINDTLVVNSAMPSDTFNIAYGGEITKETCTAVMGFFMERKLPMAFWIPPSSMIKCGKENLEQAGFNFDESDIGMHLDLKRFPPLDYKPLDHLDIAECKDDRHFIDFGNVLSTVFDPVDEHVKLFYKKISTLEESRRKKLKIVCGVCGC